MADQGWLCFILLPEETDTAAFIYIPAFMMQEGLRNHRHVQKCQRSGITVEFLQRSNPLQRSCRPEAFIVFRNPAMASFVIILLQVGIPLGVKFFKSPDFFELYFADKGE